MKKHFRPGKQATIFTLAAVALLLALGTWQVQRLHEKIAQLAFIRDSMAQKPVPLPEVLDNPDTWEYRRVTMAGRFMHDKTFLIKPRTMDGRSGYHMLTPFRRASGGMVFVNRGWISDEAMPDAERPRGMVKIEGIVQLPKKAHFTPENNPGKNDWYWADVRAMAEAAKLGEVMPAVVTVAARAPGVYPAGGQVRIDIPNDHAQYAAFWYFMAFALAVIYFVFHWRPDAELPKA